MRVDLGLLKKNEKAIDSDKLNGQLATYYGKQSDIEDLESNKLDATAKATDSNKLNSQLASYYGKQSDINTINQNLENLSTQIGSKAVIAQGNNWIKFDNDVKICWGGGSVSLEANNGTETITINLPISFTTNPTGFVTGNSQSTFTTLTVISTTTTNLTVWARNTYTTSTTVKYSWLIIGK